MNVFITERGLFSNDRHDYPISHANPVNKVEAPQKVSDNYSIVREVEQAYVAENTPAYNISISSMGMAALESMAELSKDFDAYYDQLASDYLGDRTADSENTENAQQDRIADEDASNRINGVADNVVNGTDSTFANGVNGQKSVTAVANDLDTIIREEVYEPAADDSVQTIYDNAVSDVKQNELFEEAESPLETEIIEEPGRIDVLDEDISRLEQREPYQIPGNDEVEPGSDKLLQPTIEEREFEQEVREEARPENNPVIRQAMAAYNYQMSFAINLAMTQ
ncbi:MAG: hypothetical protein K5655_10005 [Lachnospiraceae bacterium]|nr:hypothetical protein [Lachnospiraceae bacterium]